MASVQDNDVLAGLQMFQQSVQQLAQTRAINQARETVDQIHASDLDEEQKLSAFKQLGRQFALQAAASGMPFEQAKGLAEAISPKPQLYQTAEQAALNAEPGTKAQKLGVDLIDQKNQQTMSLEQMKENSAFARTKYQVDALSGRTDQKRRDNQFKALDGLLDNFTKQPDIKPLLETRNKINEVQAIDDAKLSDTSVGFNLMKKGLARLAEGGGKLTDQDYEIIQGSPDLKTRVRRYIELTAEGKPLKEDVEVVRKAAQVLGSAVNSRLHETAQGLVDSKAGIWDSVPADELQRRVFTRLGFQAPSVRAPQTAAPTAAAPVSPAAPAPQQQSGGFDFRSYRIQPSGKMR